MDFFSFTGIKLAEPVSQVNQGRLETTLVETKTTRPDSEEGVWGVPIRDPTSQQKQLASVYARVDSDEDDPSSAWVEVFYDDVGDPCVNVDLDPHTLLNKDIYLECEDKINKVEASAKAIDDDGDLVVTVSALALPAPAGVVSYAKQKESSDFLFTLLNRKDPAGPAFPGLYDVDSDLNVSVWTRSGVATLPFLAPAGTLAGQYFF